MTNTPALEQDRPLPDGWRWARLGDVCCQSRTLVEPSSKLAKTLPYLSLENVESQTGRILHNVTDEREVQSVTFAFDSRHVLFGKLRPYLNKVALPDYAGRCTTELIPLLPIESDRHFLLWLLRRQETVEVAMRAKTGSRMPRADMNDLLKMSVPLPPLPEQQRIAARLTEQMACVEETRAAALAQLQAIQQLPAAFLHMAFHPDSLILYKAKPGFAALADGQMPLPDGWQWVRLREIVRLATHSINPLQHKSEMFAHYSIPAFDEGEGPVIELGGGILSNKFAFPNKAVLFSKLNPRISRVWLVDDEHGHTRICSTEFLPLAPSDLVDINYLKFALENPTLVDDLRGRVSAATKSRERLKPELVLDATIPLPPLAEQKQIAAHLTEQMQEINTARQEAQARLDYIQALPAALLAQAFSGETTAAPSTL